MNGQGQTWSGGCQCGAVRFHLDPPFADTELCHCRTCQKAHGAPVVAWTTVQKAAVHWTRGQPSYFRSSQVAVRGFCNRCGTPMIFERDDSDTLDIAVASLDTPQTLTPAIQYGTDSRMPWFETAHLLPGEKRPEQGRSFQHPDHDTDVWPTEEGKP